MCESLQDTARRWVSEATEALTEQYAMRQRGREMEREKEGPSLNHTGVVEGTSRASAECGGAGGDYGHRNDVSTVAERGLDESESKMTHTEEMMKGKHVK